MTNHMRWAVPLFVSVLFLAASTTAVAQTKDKDKIYREFEADHLGNLLKDLDIKFKMTQPAKQEKTFEFEFERNNYNIRMKLTQGKVIGLAAFFPKVSLEKINEWNRKAKFSRASLSTVDGREYAVVDGQLNTGGGVTDGMVKHFLRRFDEEVARFDNFLRN